MRFVPLALLVALSAVPALAQPSPVAGTTSTPPGAAEPSATPGQTAPGAAAPRTHRATMQQRYDAANTSHDGKLTLAQALMGHMPRVAKNFDAIDAGHKGYVTMDDIRAYGRAQRAARRAARH